MKLNQQIITVLDVDFDVYFTTFKEPHHELEVEVVKVILDGWDVTEIISDWTYSKIIHKLDLTSIKGD